MRFGAHGLHLAVERKGQAVGGAVAELAPRSGDGEGGAFLRRWHGADLVPDRPLYRLEFPFALAGPFARGRRRGRVDVDGDQKPALGCREIVAGADVPSVLVIAEHFRPAEIADPERKGRLRFAMDIGPAGLDSILGGSRLPAG